ncbi:hypothetical protein B0H10DRAFT_1786175 [Mycena sp. CBHHK59/15]|nr:hypothetical protein B0H10DRAFT_1786175 [Mycena sp. CBHHK59/15]
MLNIYISFRNWAVAMIVLSLIGLAIGLEVALALSTKYHGFPTPTRNVFMGFSPRFLTVCFFSTLLVAGLLIIWQSSDRSYRELQPYIALAKGNVTAAEGLLANYVSCHVYCIPQLMRSHQAVRPEVSYLKQTTVILSLTKHVGIFVQSTNTLGLALDVDQLTAFSAAAGFAEAAVFHGLPDPPFIRGGWSISEFEFPAWSVLNGTLSVNTTAVQTNASCEVPTAFQLSTPGTTDFTIQASSAAGCNASVTFDPETSSNMQYGVVSVAGCGATEVQFQPVMFWFFHRKSDDILTPQGASVFCTPTIRAYNVIADVDLNNGSIIRVTQLDNVTTPNNVTGSPLNGQAFNSLKFPPSNDSIVQARAISISAGVSGAIFRFASQLWGDVQSTFDDPNGFLAITSKVYTQHLSISAKSIYFVAATSQSPAKLGSLVPRLWIDAFPTHALAVVLTLIALSALSLHIAHSRQRRRFFLAASPGSIAHIVAMTAHARFGEQLYPYDDDETLARKLAGLQFGLDPRTGAVVADRDVGSVTPYTLTTASACSSSTALSDRTVSVLSDTRPMRPSSMADEKRDARARASTSALSDSTAGRSREVESQTARLLQVDEKRGAR